jgi:hypothetical protein
LGIEKNKEMKKKEKKKETKGTVESDHRNDKK